MRLDVVRDFHRCLKVGHGPPWLEILALRELPHTLGNLMEINIAM